MYHYTYKIHYSDGKYYIGVRSCNCLPEEDTKYLGSSKYTPNNLVTKKEILATFPTRTLAIEHEVYLHQFYDIAKNPLFYNQAKQTSKKFDVTGTKQSKEHSQKIANALKGRKYSKERIEKAREGIRKKHEELRKKQGYVYKRSKETCEKIRQLKLGKSKSDKGVKRSIDYKATHYASRRKHIEKFQWININTQQEVFADIFEMGHLFASHKKAPVSGFREVYKGRLNSYLGWTLKRT